MNTRHTVIVVMRNNVDSYNGSSHFVAVAVDKEAAKRWIQDEVDGKHRGARQYAQGNSADWWIETGIFSLHEHFVQE